MQLIEAEPCGRCGVLLPVGTVVREFDASWQSSAKRIRCQTCFGECPPSQDPRRTVPSSKTGKSLAGRMTHLGELAKQFPVREYHPPKATVRVVKKKAYRGETKATQKPMLDELPWYYK